MYIIRGDESWEVDPILLQIAEALATRYGWKPAGTFPPRHWNQLTDELWDSSDYWSFLGQRIVGGDARCWAKALVSALDDIPDEDVLINRMHYLKQPVPLLDELESRCNRFLDLPLPEVCSGPRKRMLGELIKHLQQGQNSTLTLSTHPCQ